jgi:hypothetical protein
VGDILTNRVIVAALAIHIVLIVALFFIFRSPSSTYVRSSQATYEPLGPRAWVLIGIILVCLVLLFGRFMNL